MSKARARRTRGQKKFLQAQDNQDVIGVMEDSTIDVKNKIEEKQEDMFDAHKIKQNVLDQEDSTRNNPHVFIDFGDEDINQDITSVQTEVLEGKKEEEGTKNKKKRQRGRRQVKKFDSDQEKIEEEKVEKKQESIFENEDDFLEEEEVEMKKQEPPLRKQSSNSEQDEEAKREAQKMKNLANKKTQSQVSNYIHMHTIMNQAGYNKEERRAAIYTPLQANQHTFVYFKRYQSGFSQCYQIIGEDQRPILFCQNQRGCIGCNYYISLTKEMDKNNPAYLGKLRGNAAGSIYQLYDNGLQPNSNYDRSKFRVSMGFVEYESNFLGMKGPRKLKAIIPKVKDVGDYDMFKFSEEQTLDQFQGSNVIRFRNKSPRWNERLKSYALNFGGRVKQASIKNFILIDDSFDLEDQDKAPNAIVFGKIDDNTFALEFGAPLNLFQAFGIAMSQFDFKLKCE